MSRHHAIFLALSLALTSPLAMSADTAKPAIKASAPSSFPNLPYHSRWIGTTDRAAPTPGGKTAQGFYNPICTQPDKPCNGDNQDGDPRDAFNNGGWTEVLDTSVPGANNVLERVTVYGHSTSPFPNGICIGSECRIYNETLFNIALMSTDPITEVIFNYLDTALGVAFRLLERCVVTPPTNATQTPDQDERDNFWVARSSIMHTYAGNTNMLRMGMRVDVSYPINHIVRFIITGTDSNANPKVTSMVRFLDGIPVGEPTPCRP